jgi:hypothetical protein
MAIGDLDFFGRQKDHHIGPEEAGVWELVLHALLFSFSLGRVAVLSVHNTHGTREYLKIDMLKWVSSANQLSSSNHLQLAPFLRSSNHLAESAFRSCIIGWAPI